MANGNGGGTLTLSWSQFLLMLAMFAGIVAAWYDMRSQVADVRADIRSLRTINDIQERRLDRLEQRP